MLEDTDERGQTVIELLARIHTKL